MNYKVSVVIPVYNAEKTLVRCVESIVYGEFKDIEIILVEDCSKDNSWEICCSLEKNFQNVRAVRNEVNSGVSHTRNYGLNEATGEYVLFVDSDDWVSSKYALELFNIGERYCDDLVMCGFTFIDFVENNRCSYLFNEHEKISYIRRIDYFKLVDCVHLQAIWNKLFRLDIIRDNHLQFDEKQSMGEDFQFVLDYLIKGKISQCVVINQPLVYYIRHNQNSLMSNFALTSFEQAAKRLYILGQICGSEEKYLQQIQNLKENYTYHISRNNSINSKEKIKLINSLWKDNSGKKRYQEHLMNSCKEKLVGSKTVFLSIYSRFIAKVRRERQERRIKLLRQQFHQSEFTLISQNCIGGVFYHDMGMKFDSPTINLFFYADDYLHFVLNLDYYLSFPLEMHWGEEYPIGILGDVKIYFMHYKTCTEAEESWNRRVQRIHQDKIMVLATDRNGFGKEEYQMWKKIPYPKLLFTVHPEFSEDSVLYPEYADEGCVPDLISQRKFYKDGKLMRIINSFAEGN